MKQKYLINNEKDMCKKNQPTIKNELFYKLFIIFKHERLHNDVIIDFFVLARKIDQGEKPHFVYVGFMRDSCLQWKVNLYN